jgi:cobalt/nickel transport system permease protein
MHIPDGYLSPSTCAVMYASAAPFWVVAFRRLRDRLSAQFIPLLSFFSAFSFVIMMFNIPLPGGTTGHAVGMGIGAIVLGPWGSMIAISVALLIQALFFGDGGITAYGANSFNMAIVGSVASFWVYRLISSRSPIDSPRRVVAAFVAGYAVITVSALCAAIQFGVQPALFRDATGAPLYAPYPLGIAVPAMLIGHLTFAGLAEGMLSAGMVAYLQRANPRLLAAAAASALSGGTPGPAPGESVWTALRPLWISLALVMILTPLGLLAVGTAWGEWSVTDLSDPEMRAQISAASQHVEPPLTPPRGLERFASVWTAPFPDYAPSFLKSAAFGYMLSAMMGVGLILASCLLAVALFRRFAHSLPSEKGFDS